MRSALLAAALLGILAAAGFGLWRGWREVGVAVPLIGWIAIGVGALLSIALGVGLMALSFYSARSGHDERAATDPRDDQ